MHQLLAPSTSSLDSSLTPSTDDLLRCLSQEDLLHELRQPLSAIECIAYYLEITSSEERVRVQLERIQSMISKANCILDRQSAGQLKAPR